MPRGGKRNGTPGKTYPNRSDLTPTAATGQQYGMAKQQLDAQQQMPIAPPPTPQILPGAQGPLTRPTERPDEPMSAGAPWGPGPNEIPGLPSGNPDLSRLFRQLPFLEEIASHPNASTQTRQLYRQVVSAYLRNQG